MEKILRYSEQEEVKWSFDYNIFLYGKNITFVCVITASLFGTHGVIRNWSNDRLSLSKNTIMSFDKINLH